MIPLPAPGWLRVGLVVGALIAIGALVARVSVLKRDVLIEQGRAASAAERFEAVERAASAAQQEREKERRHARASVEAADRAASAATAEAAAAVRAAAAADGLRVAAARAAAVCRRGVPADPADASNGTATPDPGLVLADVLGRARNRLQELGRLADARGIAGSTCERERDALTTQAE